MSKKYFRAIGQQFASLRPGVPAFGALTKGMPRWARNTVIEAAVYQNGPSFRKLTARAGQRT